jgi:hypothetical protein
MIERLESKADGVLWNKVVELIDAINEIERREQQRNYQTHQNIIKVGDGELAYCTDCHGGEVELWEATCSSRCGLTVI